MEKQIILIVGFIAILSCTPTESKGGFRPQRSSIAKHFKVQINIFDLVLKVCRNIAKYKMKCIL